MSIPKKGSRKIIVEDEPFIWLIRKVTSRQLDGQGGDIIRVAVEHAEVPGSSLVIRTDRIHPEGYTVTRDEINPVTPADVSLWIKQAIEIGWLPKTDNKTFQVSVCHEGLKKQNKGLW